jgi:hypothetical protein
MQPARERGADVALPAKLGPTPGDAQGAYVGVT